MAMVVMAVVVIVKVGFRPGDDLFQLAAIKPHASTPWAGVDFDSLSLLDRQFGFATGAIHGYFLSSQAVGSAAGAGAGVLRFASTEATIPAARISNTTTSR